MAADLKNNIEIAQKKLNGDQASMRWSDVDATCTEIVAEGLAPQSWMCTVKIRAVIDADSNYTNIIENYYQLGDILVPEKQFNKLSIPNSITQLPFSVDFKDKQTGTNCILDIENRNNSGQSAEFGCTIRTSRNWYK